MPFYQPFAGILQVAKAAGTSGVALAEEEDSEIASNILVASLSQKFSGIPIGPPKVIEVRNPIV